MRLSKFMQRCMHADLTWIGRSCAGMGGQGGGGALDISRKIGCAAVYRKVVLLMFGPDLLHSMLLRGLCNRQSARAYPTVNKSVPYPNGIYQAPQRARQLRGRFRFLVPHMSLVP